MVYGGKLNDRLQTIFSYSLSLTKSIIYKGTQQNLHEPGKQIVLKPIYDEKDPEIISKKCKNSDPQRKFW